MTAWSRKWFDELRNALRSHTLGALLSQVFVAFLYLVMNSVLARVLSERDFGEWVLFQSGAALLDILAYSMTGPGYIHFFSQAKTLNEQNALKGAIGVMSLCYTGAIAAILWGLFFLGETFGSETGFRSLLLWYPLIALSAFPLRNRSIHMLALQNHRGFAAANALPLGIFLIAIVVNHLTLQLGLPFVLGAYLASHALGSMVILGMRWVELSSIQYSTKEWTTKLVNYGRYTAGSSLGSSLLKNTDVLLIGMFRSPAEAASFSIPLRLMQVIEIPLNALATLVFVKISQLHHAHDSRAVVPMFSSYVLRSTLLLLPIIAGCLVFSSPLIWLLGGDRYLLDPLTTAVFQIFLIGSLFVSLERLTGAVLDGTQQPEKNFYKVMVMVVVNLIGDVFILLLCSSLQWIAFVTVVNVFVGIILGLFFLRKTFRRELP